MASDRRLAVRQTHGFPGHADPSPPSGRSSPQKSGHRRSQSQQTSTISSIFSARSVNSSGTAHSIYTRHRTSASTDGEPGSPDSVDSLESIVDDVFFQRYIDAERPDDLTGIYDPTLRFTSHDTPPPDYRPRIESVTIQLPEIETLPLLPSNNADYIATMATMTAMEGINIAVIGANGVGKSHFIQRALGLSRLPGAQPSTMRINVDGTPYAVTLFELDLEYFDVDPDKQIQWPKQVGGSMMPVVHGVLLLYDVMNRDSIIELPQTLTALVNSSLPTVLVATKCDNPESLRQIDTEGMAKACESCIECVKTSTNKPETTRNALSVMLRALVVDHPEIALDGANLRRRAASAAHLDTPFDPASGRPLSQHSKHSRASSDMSLLRGFVAQSVKDHGTSSRSPRIDYTGQGVEGLSDDQTVSSMLRSPGIRLDRANSAAFLDLDDDDGDSLRYSEDIPILQRTDEAIFERPAKRTGVSFDELVDRLVSKKMSRGDQNFSEVFLCLYRKFEAPGKLLDAIKSRLERGMTDKSVHYLNRTVTQLQIIEAAAKWVALYPGDFAHRQTRRKLEEFIRNLSHEPVFAAAASQMRRNLEQGSLEEDDLGWAKSDEDDEEEEEDDDPIKIGTELNQTLSNLNVEDNPGRRPSASSSIYAESTISGKTQQYQYHSYEDYEREAATMVPTLQIPLTKFRYHIFMDTSDDDLADEMTRIDWVIFSSIRIRDLVRHVSLNLEQRSRCKSMKNVNRMISHFNHIAKWVANMILMRDKPKHRALMLEKFMNIALKLRVLNNYNGLAAVLAGINGTAVHRLSQTRALVPAEVQKRFARLVLLMGTQKSHFAYRLAWENSSLPRIPFMPLHRRDLVSAEEGSMTFVGPEGDRINWKKFEVLGEVILPIMRSQTTPYPNLVKHEVARECILECLMPTDDEEIYQRSLQVEGSGTAAVDGGARKKFQWFAGK